LGRVGKTALGKGEGDVVGKNTIGGVLKNGERVEREKLGGVPNQRRSVNILGWKGRPGQRRNLHTGGKNQSAQKRPETGGHRRAGIKNPAIIRSEAKEGPPKVGLAKSLVWESEKKRN